MHILKLRTNLFEVLVPWAKKSKLYPSISYDHKQLRPLITTTQQVPPGLNNQDRKDWDKIQLNRFTVFMEETRHQSENDTCKVFSHAS